MRDFAGFACFDREAMNYDELMNYGDMLSNA